MYPKMVKEGSLILMLVFYKFFADVDPDLWGQHHYG